tara:strand:- start:42 stop:287 length:246 start_codon:yes stop_codon:yes gene_type:complete
MSDYNGYTNRETWVINLYLGKYFQEVADSTFGGEHLMADYIKCTVRDMLDEDNTHAIFKNMIDLGVVNWRELAAIYVSKSA